MLPNLSPEIISIFLSGASAFLVTFATVIWRISGAKNEIEEKILGTEHIAEMERARLKEDILKAKLEAYNIFIHKDSFEAAMRNLDSRLVRLETKIDKVLEKTT